MYDIMFTENWSGKLVFEIGNKLVTGVQKLVQIFIGRLLNTLGSSIASPKAGSNLLAGNLGTTNLSVVQSTATIAIADVTYTIKREQASGDYPDDERLATANLVSLNNGPDWVSLQIELRTESKTRVQFQIPIEYRA